MSLKLHICGLIYLESMESNMKILLNLTTLCFAALGLPSVVNAYCLCGLRTGFTKWVITEPVCSHCLLSWHWAPLTAVWLHCVIALLHPLKYLYTLSSPEPPEGLTVLLLKDVNLLEQIQRRATRMIKGIEERLRAGFVQPREQKALGQEERKSNLKAGERTLCQGV